MFPQAFGCGKHKGWFPVGTFGDPQGKAPTRKSTLLPRITKTMSHPPLKGHFIQWPMGRAHIHRDGVKRRFPAGRWYEPKGWVWELIQKDLGRWEKQSKITKKKKKWFIWGKCKWIHLLGPKKLKHRCSGETWKVLMDDCFMDNTFPAK